MASKTLLQRGREGGREGGRESERAKERDREQKHTWQAKHPRNTLPDEKENALHLVK